MLDSPTPSAFDANVLFDLHRGGILTQGLRAVDAVVPDLVLRNECDEPTGTRIRAAGAREAHFDPDELRELQTLRGQHPALSLADLSVYLLARREDATILTRDEPLASLARDQGIRVETTIWLVAYLVEENHLTPERGAEAFERMLSEERSIDRTRAREQIEEWRGA